MVRLFNHVFDFEFSCESKNVAINVKEAMPIVLIFNELILNAHRFCDSKYTIELLNKSPKTLSIEISNDGSLLPCGFDFNKKRGMKNGLSLVFSLLPKKGAELIFYMRDNKTHVNLILSPPVILEEKL